MHPWPDGRALTGDSCYYEQARNVNRMNPVSHYNLGMSYESFGDVEQAFKHYEEFLRINHPMYREQAEALKLKLKR